MNRLELAWSAWRGLSKIERKEFLHLLRGAYAAEREAARRANGHGAHGARVETLRELTLTEADFRAAVVE
jgi:hypothetical protein